MRDEVDEILKATPGKSEADEVYTDMKQISKNLRASSVEGKIDQHKLARLLNNTDGSNRFRENLTEMRAWALDPQFDPKARGDVQNFLNSFDDAVKTMGQKQELIKFRYDQGVSSPEIQRLGSQLGKKSLVQDAISSPSGFIKSTDEFVRTFAPAVAGKSYKEMDEVEKTAFVKMWTWYRSELNKKLPTPPTPENMQQKFELFKRNVGKK